MTEKTSTLKYTNARLLAIQAIYMSEFSDENIDRITSRFVLGEVGGQVIVEREKGKEEVIDIQSADLKLFTKIMKEYVDKKESF